MDDPRNVRFFEFLSDEERAEFAELAVFEPGEALIEEGGPEKHLQVLTSGTVEVHKEVFSGRQQHLSTIEATAVIGEMGLVTEPRAAATVTAKGPVEARRLPREVFLEKLESGSGMVYKVAYEIGRTLAGKMAQTDEFIAKVVAELEDAESDRDFEVFRDKLIREWSF